MPVILVEGPEKAGKSTLVRALLKRIPNAKVRKFTGPIQGDEYSEALLEDTLPSLFPLITIWDRGWVSEWVYSGLLRRPSKLTGDRAQFFDEWLIGAGGVGVVLLGPDIKTLTKNRDETDLEVDPEAERLYFSEYASALPGWLVYDNEHSESYVGHMAALILKMLEVKK